MCFFLFEIRSKKNPYYTGGIDKIFISERKCKCATNTKYPVTLKVVIGKWFQHQSNMPELLHPPSHVCLTDLKISSPSLTSTLRHALLHWILDTADVLSLIGQYAIPGHTAVDRAPLDYNLDEQQLQPCDYLLIRDIFSHTN